METDPPEGPDAGVAQIIITLEDIMENTLVMTENYL